MKKVKTKGFTLIELMVVIAIIGIITLLVVPNWMHSIQKSHVQEQNSKARVVFNAAQSVCQDYYFKERMNKDTTADPNDFVDTDKSNTGNLFRVYFNCSDPTHPIATDENGNIKHPQLVEDFTNAVNHIFSDYENTSYWLVIEDYTVRAAFTGTDETSQYIGSFPAKQTERNNDDIEVRDLVQDFIDNMTP